MSPEPGANELRYRRQLAWQSLREGRPIEALYAAYHAWDFYRFLKTRRVQ